MKDPLDQWAEGEASDASQGDFPGHIAGLAGEWSDRRPTEARSPDWLDDDQSAISETVQVLGPSRRRNEDRPPLPELRPPEEKKNKKKSSPKKAARARPSESRSEQPPQAARTPPPTPRARTTAPRRDPAADRNSPPARELAHEPPPVPRRSGPTPDRTPAPTRKPPPAPAPARAPAVSPAGAGGGGRLPGKEFASRLQAPRPKRRPKRARPLRRTVLILITVVLVGSTGSYVWAETKLQRDVDLNHFGSRPAAGEGTTYLIVGSDSRQGLSEAARKELHTGVFGGRRTDSMILMHKGKNGTTMVSLPRDSWVTIPGYTRPSTGKRTKPVQNKLNAAFSQGGPELLISTIEQNTDVRIDHYAEIGFAGFVSIVDAIGGVPMCIDRDIKDKRSGTDLKKGCQTLNGTQSLAFVRQRHQEADGDLGRTRNQQKFLSALAKKAGKRDTLLDPSHLYPAISAGLDTLVVDEDMSMRDLTKMFQSVKGTAGGRGQQVNVPTSGGINTSKGSAVRWNEAQAKQLFEDLKNDRPVSVPEKPVPK
jgi:LCP family protein required for cell wall assembly